MKRLEFKKIDAFASNNSEGNPAGYIKLHNENELSSSEMLLIAKQLKNYVNEVGFICKIHNDLFKLRYFSSEKEVEFCGHATIAIMYDLIKNDKGLINKESIYIDTNKGKLKVENKINKEDAVYIYSPEPKFINNIPEKKSLLKALNINESYIDNKYSISIINAGLDTLIIPINGLNNILKINPDFTVLKNFCIDNNIDIIEIFSDEVYDSKNNYRTRVFAPRFGYLEDPATGSGNSAFGYYLINNNLWETDLLCIEQNNLKDKFNVVKLRKSINIENEIRVLFGGSAIVRIEGQYLLNNI